MVIYKDIHYFCQKQEGPHDWVKLYDIFSGKKIQSCTKFDFLRCNHNSLDGFNAYPIREFFPEVNVYPNEQVPRLLLQKLYYEANGIDNKILKKSMIKRNEE